MINQQDTLYNVEMTIEYDCPDGYDCEPWIIPEETVSWIPPLPCEHPDSAEYPCDADCNDPTHPDFPCEDDVIIDGGPTITPTEENGPVFYNVEQTYDCEDAGYPVGADTITIEAGVCSGVTQAAANLAAFNLAKAQFDAKVLSGEISCSAWVLEGETIGAGWSCPIRPPQNVVVEGPLTIDINLRRTCTDVFGAEWYYWTSIYLPLGPFDTARRIRVTSTVDLAKLGVGPPTFFSSPQFACWIDSNPSAIYLHPSPTALSVEFYAFDTHVGTGFSEYVLPAGNTCYVTLFVWVLNYLSTICQNESETVVTITDP